jgi:RNA polymerase sigma-70 factor (ECF subfamily)
MTHDDTDLAAERSEPAMINWTLDEPAGFDAGEIRGPTRHLPRGQALGALLADLQPRLTAVALRITRDPEAARDVVQNAFVKVLRHGDSFRGQSRISTWLHRIVANEALMWIRSEKRRREIQTGPDLDRIVDESPDPAASLLARETRSRVRNGLSQLGECDRDLIERCNLAEGSYAEYGAFSGLHVAAVKSRAFRARRRLGEILGND